MKSTPINVTAKEKKKGRIKTIILIWLQATKAFHCELRSPFKIITRRGWEQKKYKCMKNEMERKKKPLKKKNQESDWKSF